MASKHPTRTASTSNAAPPNASAAPTRASADSRRPGQPASQHAPSKATAAVKGATGTTAARGHDVADVRVVGLEFPYPGYLDNLVRQVRLRFEPTQASAGLHADLAFVVGRDGAVTGLRVVRGSGSYAFDLEAQGAVEAAGAARAFGPLPDRFHAPALPVTFSFDPRATP
ncbi:hypothetical protein tb265_35790 [Gemmatimonadetes bacterium T265]|nr:hypothetical protein tb265_35790 [Gemmatimonadetes bacterium T265]